MSYCLFPYPAQSSSYPGLENHTLKEIIFYKIILSYRIVVQSFRGNQKQLYIIILTIYKKRTFSVRYFL
jgi:hypothetical protein